MFKILLGMLIIISSVVYTGDLAELKNINSLFVDDTKNIVKQISRHGTKVIGIALDDSSCTCFDTLKAIYPNLLQCADLKELTKKLLGIISDVV